MHPGDGDAHERCRHQLRQQQTIRVARLHPEKNHQGGKGGADGNYDRSNNQHRIPDDGRHHLHCPHADVVHRTDTGAHGQAADHQLMRGQAGTACNVECDTGRKDRRDPRKQCDGQVVAHRHGQRQSHHCHEVHRPDSGPHGQRTADQPCLGDSAFGPDHAPCKVKCDIRGEHGQDDRQQHQVPVVVRGHVQTGRLRPLNGHGSPPARRMMPASNQRRFSAGQGSRPVSESLEAYTTNTWKRVVTPISGGAADGRPGEERVSRVRTLSSGVGARESWTYS